MRPRLRHLRMIAATARNYAAMAREYRAGPLALYRRALWLRWHGKLGFRESLAEGLLDPTLPRDALRACVGKDYLIELQRRVNAPERECLTEDKSIFYPYCESLGLPVPKLHAVFGTRGGFACGGPPLIGRDAWTAYFENGMPAECVVKPAFGYYGLGVRVLRRVDGALVQHDGRRLTGADLFDELRAAGDFSKYVIQERAEPHPALRELSQSEALQTARIITRVQDDRISIEHAFLRIARQGNAIDNLHHGRTGNLAARIDCDTGRLAEGWLYNHLNVLTRTDRHPVTGRPLAGFQLPQWEAAKALVARAAVLFLPSRCLGWDVAFTPTGPVVLETNMWWDPTNVFGIDLSAPRGHEHADTLLRDLRLAAAGPRIDFRS